MGHSRTPAEKVKARERLVKNEAKRGRIIPLVKK